MRVIFAGTPAFAVPVLRALAASGHEVVLVVSQPDRPKGRGRVLEPTPVRAAADAMRLRCVQPERLRDAEEDLRSARADVLVTAAYGQKVPDRLLALPRLGGLNVHASLLPRHRGAAPVASAILAGDAETGISVFRMVREMDAGPVLHTSTLHVPPAANAGDLEGLLAERAGPVLLEALAKLEAGAPFVEQDHARATLAPRLAREDGLLDWNRPADELARRVRAMNPWPGAAAAFVRPDGRRARVLVLAANPVEGEFPGAPGDVLEVRRAAIRVRAGAGALDLTRLQPESRKPLTADEFANGFRLRASGGFRFENGQ
ncbi:MAG: methionyl-tRNA formyltransferase [Planctomycetes bacterium]|nr:methionyl-tRNA formyltransferase [Planctomycetota bacterium]